MSENIKEFNTAADVAPDPAASKTIDPKKRIIAVIACLIVQFCVGILYVWSVLKGKVQQHYGWGDEANLVYSFMLFGFVFGNLIGGYLQDKTNPRLIGAIGCAMFCSGIILSSFIPKGGSIVFFFITYSLLSGLGCGFAYGCMLNCLQSWFPTRRGFASGMSCCAFALSTVVFSPLFRSLLGNYSVPNVFRIFGISCFIITMLACFFISSPAAITNKALLTGLTPKQVVKKGAFWCIAITCFFINASWNILAPIIGNVIETNAFAGKSDEFITTIITVTVMITGVTNASGRLSMASASDKMGRGKAMGLMAVITFVAAIGLIWAKSYFCLILIAVVAFGYGGPAAILPPMATDVGGKKYGGTNYGLALLSLGLSSVIFTALSNLLVNATGSYTASFIMAAATCVFPVVLMYIYGRLMRKEVK